MTKDVGLKIKTKVNTKPVESLKDLLDYCAAAADRLGDAMSRINPDLLGAGKGIDDHLARDMRTAVAMSETSDSVIKSMARLWLREMIFTRCHMLGIADPFMGYEQSAAAPDAKIEINTGAVTGDIFQVDSHKTTISFIEPDTDPDLKEVPGKFTGEAVSFSVEGIGTFNIGADSSGALAVILENLDKPAMVEALNKHYGVSLLVPGEPMKEWKPKIITSAGFQVQGPDGVWTHPLPGRPTGYYDKLGIRTREIFAYEE